MDAFAAQLADELLHLLKVLAYSILCTQCLADLPGIPAAAFGSSVYSIRPLFSSLLNAFAQLQPMPVPIYLPFHALTLSLSTFSRTQVC